MCGIVGLVNKGIGGLFSSDVGLFNQLLYIDALRGEDSTGAIGYMNNGDMLVIKDAVDANTFLNTEEYNKFASKVSKTGKALIGHNRKKTVGKIDPTTAHPFIVDDRFAFVHNGTLYSHKHLADTEVDSEALGIVLSKCEGNKEKLEATLEKVHGAYACAWIDQKEEKLYLLRNEERPLYIAESAGVYFFASEQSAIAHILIRNSMKVDKIDKVKENTLYIFDISNKAAITGYQEVALSVKKYPAPYTSTPSGGTGSGGTTEYKGCFQEVTNHKNYKKFRKEFLGTILSFHCMDYYPLSADADNDKWLMLGESFLIPNFNHTIQGEVCGLDEHRVHELSERLLLAQVEDVTWNEKDKCMIIFVKNIQVNKYYKPH